MKKVVIIAAGGSGTRMHAGFNKVLLPLAGKTVIRRSMEVFRNFADEMIIAVRHEDEEAIRREAALAGLPFPVRLVSGGTSRQESVLNALRAFSWEADDIALVHDAARCMVDEALIWRVIDSCVRYGSGVPAVPAISTYKQVDTDRFVIKTVSRSSLFEIQTPQGFQGSALLIASEKAALQNLEVTDDASVMEIAGYKVRTVAGSVWNVKLTTMEDFMAAETRLSGMGLRIGTGYDVHRLVEGRKLILCGVEIPWEKGLLGHSDADVALHALMDAMFGAAALGDIGKHFPDTDDQYLGISSLLLLNKTARLLSRAGYRMINADLTIVAQKPKLQSFIPEMRKNIAEAAECELNAVNVKATTTESLGFEGRMEGISAQAVCMIQRISGLFQVNE